VTVRNIAVAVSVCATHHSNSGDSLRLSVPQRARHQSEARPVVSAVGRAAWAGNIRPAPQSAQTTGGVYRTLGGAPRLELADGDDVGHRQISRAVVTQVGYSGRCIVGPVEKSSTTSVVARQIVGSTR